MKMNKMPAVRQAVKLVVFTAIAGLSVVTNYLYADDKKPALDERSAAIAAKIMQARPDLNVTAIEATGIPGVDKATVGGRGAIYVIQNGDYFFVGDLYRVDKNEIVNVTEMEKNGEREKLLASLDKNDMIVFSPKGQVKASITVFTDVDCGYCQKLHQEVPQMNDMGIEVRYLAYPRAGIGSPSYEKVVSAWCSDNRQDALTRLKQRQSIPTNLCEKNPVDEQFEIGHLMGVTGTPSLILEDGEMLPGYVPADRLAQKLGIM